MVIMKNKTETEPCSGETKNTTQVRSGEGAIA
jgi:hypothetical protein